jgi:hypothetical protein
LRRWNAFNIAIHSIVGLVLALLIGWRLGIELTSECKWTSGVVGGFVPLYWSGRLVGDNADAGFSSASHGSEGAEVNYSIR